jgi:hypothetical protein
MKNRIVGFTLLAVLLLGSNLRSQAAPETPIFDGKTFKGWEGNTNTMWKIKDGAIVGGYLDKKIPHNEFLCTTAQYTNFILRLEFKLLGTNGFINAGVQVRSQRVPNHHEVSGYQADLGNGWWGALYDEARRDKILAKPDAGVAEKAVKQNEWNQYEIRCEGNKITLKINGVQTVSYTEEDPKIPQFGILGLQVHGGGAAEVHYRNLRIEQLP